MTVKFTDEERVRLKTLAASLGWTESQIIRDSLAHVFHLIHHPDSADEPKLITMGRLALCHDKNPSLLQRHVKQLQRGKGSSHS